LVVGKGDHVDYSSCIEVALLEEVVERVLSG